MSGMAREKRHGGEAIPVVTMLTTYELSVGTGAACCYLSIGPVPNAEAVPRIRIPPMVPEYFRVEPGKDKIAAKAGAPAAVTSASFITADVTVIRVLYDDVAGVLEVMEAKP